jgi:hypothetical protein
VLQLATAHGVVDIFQFFSVPAREVFEKAQSACTGVWIHEPCIRDNLPPLTLQVPKRKVNVVAPPAKSVVMDYGSDLLHGNPLSFAPN